jgi:hypothetical protein
MIEREHFKTCVRAYFPEHDFYWLDRFPVDYVACIYLNGLANLASNPNEEQTLLHILRQYANDRLCDPSTLTFVGEGFTLSRDNDTDFNLVFVLKDMQISSYARQLFNPFD